MKALGYIRCSTDKQDLSLEQQREKLREYASSKGWELTEVFADDAISGSDFDRPGLQAFIERSQTSQDTEAVLLWDRNRLARPKDPVDGIMLERKLMDAGKRIVYVSTGQEANRTFASGLMSYIEHYQNGDYLRKLSRDTMRGMVDRAKKGLWAGGPSPWGYDRLIMDSQHNPKRIVRDVCDGSRVILNPETFEIIETVPAGMNYKKQDHEICLLVPSESARVRAVVKIFTDFANGVPMRKIRDDLNAAGFRSSRGRKFTSGTLLGIIESQAYLGRCIYNRRTLSKWHRLVDGNSIEREDQGFEMRPESDWIVTDNAWEPLIDEETFDKAQKMRGATKKAYAVAAIQPRSEFLLTGLAFCGVCGGKLSGYTKTSGKGYRTRYYVCNTYHRGDHESCPKRYSVPAAKVENHILEHIKKDLAVLGNDKQLAVCVRDELQRLSDYQGDSRNELQRQLAGIDQKLAHLREHLANLDSATAKALGFYDQALELSHDKEKLESALRAIALPKLPPLETIQTRVRAAVGCMSEILERGTIEEKRLLIATYVKKIEADSTCNRVVISFYRPLFTSVIAGAGFEPTTSGL